LNIGAAISTPEEFAASLEEELQAFREFVQILQTEQETLVRGDVDRLIDLARIKSEKVVLLSQLAAKRTRFLSSSGFGPDLGGIEHWLKQHDAGAMQKITPTWNALLEEARRAQHLNQTNGVMIENGMRNNQHALAVLQAAAMQQATYGPDGQTHATGTGRPLGKV